MWSLGDVFEKNDRLRYEKERKSHTDMICDPDVCFYCHLERRQKEEAEKGQEISSEMIPTNDLTD